MKICWPLYFCVKVCFELLEVLSAMPHLCGLLFQEGSLT
jgi:hypothetical protein